MVVDYQPLNSDSASPVADSVVDLRQHQRQLIREQDDHLECLAGVISRQRGMAAAINDEISEQNVLIDNITDLAERGTTRISQQSRQVRELSRHTSATCCYWVFIVALFVAIILVLLL
nr:syntaxin 8-like protein [Parasacculina yatsui]